MRHANGQRLIPGERVRSRSGASSVPRYQSLRRAIERTRTQITDYRTIVSRVQSQFDGMVRPLEMSMTACVLRLTHRLVDHHDHAQLDLSDKSVLGLWISDNVASLSEHPFADRDAVVELARRWRESLRLESADSGCSPESRSDSRQTRGPAPDLASGHTAAGLEQEGAESEQYRSTAEESGHTSDDPSRDDSPTDENAEPRRRRSSSEPGHLSDAPATDDLQVLMGQLFRQLAAVLHPDREPDARVKQIKDVLMGDCLKARQEGDLATLLSLHATHVGGEQRINDAQMRQLLSSLERQLRALQTQLRQIRFGNSLQSMMVERYLGHDDRDTADRFARHARSLREEIRRLQALEQSLVTTCGLNDALAHRRDKLLDRMAINQMTGL